MLIKKTNGTSKSLRLTQALPFAAFQLHRIFQASFVMGVLANTGTLGAMAAKIDRAVKVRFLTRPDTVFNFGNDATTDRTVGAYGSNAFDLVASRGLCCGWLDMT